MRFIYLAIFMLGYVSYTHAEAELACTDNSSPRECYEASLSLVGKILGELRAKEAELDDKLASVSVPAGAVMAFDRNNGCPSGWRDYSIAMGRVIVGADPPAWTQADPRNRDEIDRALSARHFREPGGTESFKLDPDNLPSLEVLMSNRDNALFFTSEWASRNDDNHHNMVNLVKDKPDVGNYVSLKIEGKSAEKKFMPPYVPLYYCIKQ